MAPHILCCHEIITLMNCSYSILYLTSTQKVLPKYYLNEYVFTTLLIQSSSNSSLLGKGTRRSFFFFFFNWNIGDTPGIRDSLVGQMIKSLPAMRETRVQTLGWENPLEKAMATHSSILAWKSPWPEEPGRLQSMGLQIVRHDWVTLIHFHFQVICNTILVSGVQPIDLICAVLLRYKWHKTFY